MHKQRTFDAHTHIGRWGTWTIDGTAVSPFANEFSSYDAYKTYYLTRYHPDYAVVVPHYVPDRLGAFAYNDLVADAIGRNDRLLGGFWINPSEDTLAASHVVLDCLPHPRIKVLKLSPETWTGCSLRIAEAASTIRRLWDRIIQLCLEHKLILQFHTGKGLAESEEYDHFLDAYGATGVRLHLVHMGEYGGGHMRFIPRFLRWLELGYNVYCDTSWARGFAVRWLVNELSVRGNGLERMMFASDEPWGDFPSEYSKILGLEVDQQVKDALLFKNAWTLYKGEE